MEVWILVVGLPSALAMPLMVGWPRVAGLLLLVAVQALWMAALPLLVEWFPLPEAGSSLAVGLPLAAGLPL